MTTAHRATFHAAIGGKEQGGGRYIAGVTRVHVHDLAGEMSIKQRQTGQGTAAELKGKDLKKALEDRELEHLKSIGKASIVSKAPPPLPPPEDDDDDDDGPALILDPDDADDKRTHTANDMLKPPDESDDDDDDDDEDEEEELMRELERIKQERKQEAEKREREEAENEYKERDSAILQGNPLLDPTRVGSSSGGTFAVKRRWDDDVVFKNQAREPKKEARRFINDTVRNDFHRKFLQKYIK